MDNDIILTKIRELKLSKEELINNELFIEFVEQNNLFKNDDDDQDPDKLEDNFKPDEAMKYSLRHVGAEYLIPVINEICNLNFNLNSTLEFLSTEHVGTTGDVVKRSVRGDFAVRIIPPKNTNVGEVNDIVVIEFQSSEDSEMPLRVHVYGFNHSQKIELLAKTPTGKELKPVYIYPFECVIYTTLSNKDAKGTIEYNMTYPNFEFNGVPCSAKDGDVLTKTVHYVNLLKMSVDELDKSAFAFLQGLYLYKFKKDNELIKKEDFFEIVKKIEKNLEKYNSLNNDVALKLFNNLVEDLYNIMNKNKMYYQKELDFMEYGKNTYADRLIEKGIDKGKQIGIEEGLQKERTNTILRMLKLKTTDEVINQMTGYPMAQIQEVRTQHSL